MRNKFKKKIITLVGLPCRGKSFFAKDLDSFLSKKGFSSKKFNVGDYRRLTLGVKHSSGFFDFRNKKYKNLREKAAKQCLHDMLIWTLKGGEIATYDATNITKNRRRMILKQTDRFNIENIFIELNINDKKLFNKMLSLKLKKSIDYKNVSLKEAKKDFLKRIAHYEKAYEPVSSRHKIIRISDMGTSIEINFKPKDKIEKALWVYCNKVYKNFFE